MCSDRELTDKIRSHKQDFGGTSRAAWVVHCTKRVLNPSLLHQWCEDSSCIQGPAASSLSQQTWRILALAADSFPRSVLVPLSHFPSEQPRRIWFPYFFIWRQEVGAFKLCLRCITGLFHNQAIHGISLDKNVWNIFFLNPRNKYYTIKDSAVYYCLLTLCMHVFFSPLLVL